MNFEFIEHRQVEGALIDNIIDIKNSVWEYSYESHTDWIRNNINPDDVHLILSERNVGIGYLNLVKLRINQYDGWGIGNVCVRPSMQGKQFGLLLMKLTDYFLMREKKPGVLLCKDTVVDFYKSCCWHPYTGSAIGPYEKAIDTNIMIHPLFSPRLNHEHRITLNRLF